MRSCFLLIDNTNNDCHEKKKKKKKNLYIVTVNEPRSCFVVRTRSIYLKQINQIKFV